MGDRIAVTTLILVAMAVAAPVWGPGMVNTRGGGDSPFLLQRTDQMVANLRAGVFPARWMPDAAYGLGYPFFSYYSALPYYLAGLLAIAGLDLITAIKMVQTLGFVASALAMYGWTCRTTRNRGAAWLAAVAYTVAPFHLVNVYVRGDSLSEFYAFVFYPLILWGLDRATNPESQVSDLESRAANARSHARWLWPGLAYAGLILTHNISALIFSPFVLLYVLASASRGSDRWRHSLTLGVLALGFGLLLSAWVWIPTLAERGLVQTEGLTDDYFHYSRHFRRTDLVQRSFLFDYSVVPGGDSPFAMGLPQAGFAALGGLALIARGLLHTARPGGWVRKHLRWGGIVLSLLISTAMITPFSEFLWDHLPLLSMIQFPWRFLSVQAVFAAAMTAGLVPNGRWGPWVGLMVAATLVAAILIPLRPERLVVSSADVTIERLQLYELFTQNIGTTIRYEWLPEAVVPRPFTSGALVEPASPPPAVPLGAASLDATLLARGPTRQEWRVGGGGGSVAFPLLYWPGWRAQVDGDPVQVWPVEGSGYLALTVPSGEHTVLLRLARTPVRAVAEAVSLCALLILVVVLISARLQIPWRSLIRLMTLAVLPVLAFLLLPRGQSYGQYSDDDLTMDFDQMPYLHHNPGGVGFEGGMRLVGYALSADELGPGDTLTVTLNWSTVDGVYTATVGLVSPAALRHEVAPVAEATTLVTDLPEVLTLRLPDDTPRGVILLQLRLFGPGGELHARTPSGRTRGTLYLQPVRVPRGPAIARDASVLTPFGPAIRLHAAMVTQPDADRLSIRLNWSTVRPLAANYGISLRLLDARDRTVAVLDTQPGYGFLPTSLWRPGELVSDQFMLTLPDDLSPGDEYCLMVILYQVATWEAMGQVRLGDFSVPLGTPFEARRPPRSFSPPFPQHPLAVDFGKEVRLVGYDLEQEEGGAIRLTLWWRALQSPADDYTVFVHLFDAATEAIVAQSDAMPQDGAYPTSWWTAGEVVSETVRLSLGGGAARDYLLAVGLYDRTVTRLQAVGVDGQPVPGNRVVLPEGVGVNP